MRVRLRSISLAYPGAPGPLFQDLSLDIQGPGLVGLFGLSGCGKTTLARVAAGMIRPTAGRVEVEPHPHGPGAVLYMHNQERFPSWTTVGEHLDRVTPQQDRGEWLSLARELGIQGLEGAPFQELSMGQRNRANLLRYLVQPFGLLIIDEGLANVDEPSRARILALLKARYPRRTFLYISHNVQEVAWFCRWVAVFPASQRPLERLTVVEGLDALEPPGPHSPELARLGRRLIAACMGVEG